MIRYISSGESHGPKITGIVDGLPAGFPIDQELIQSDLRRRQKGFGRSARMKIESDLIQITGGLIQGKTTGGPIGFEIQNLDHEKWKNKRIPAMTIPRPGHADLAGAIKYRHGDLRLSLERASARETAMRVAAGGVCKQILGPFGVGFGSRVLSIGGMDPRLRGEDREMDPRLRGEDREMDPRLRGEDREMDPRLRGEDRQKDYIHSTMKNGDTLGGIFEIRATGVIAGLGSYSQWDKRLDGKIAQAMLSIPAMKGVEIGPAFENATKLGSQVHDPIHIQLDNTLSRPSNNAGGLEGGVTNGEDVIVRVAMKPISTLLKKPIQSVDLKNGSATTYPYERSDFCAVERALVIGEAMLSFVLCDAFLQKLGGDSFEEISNRYKLLRRARLADLKMGEHPSKFW